MQRRLSHSSEIADLVCLPIASRRLRTLRSRASLVSDEVRLAPAGTAGAADLNSWYSPHSASMSMPSIASAKLVVVQRL